MLQSTKIVKGTIPIGKWVDLVNSNFKASLNGGDWIQAIQVDQIPSHFFLNNHIPPNHRTPRIIHREAIDLRLGGEGDAIGQAAILSVEPGQCGQCDG